MDTALLDKRKIIIKRLKEDLIGPLNSKEILNENPYDAYLVGTLFPGNLFIEEEENDDSKPESFDVDTKDEESKNLSPTKTSRPSNLGLSFAIKDNNEIEFNLNCGVYTYFEEEGDKNKKKKLWQREEINHTQILQINKKQDYIILNHPNERIQKLKIWYTKKIIDGLSYITLILLNCNTFNKEEDTGIDLSEKSFYQVHFTIKTKDTFYPKPLINKAADEDEKIYSLIYRNNQDYATGFNCSVQWNVEDSNKVKVISTEWINEQKSFNVSSAGDEIYFKDQNELTPDNFITKNKKDVIKILSNLAYSYQKWIDDLVKEAKKISFLNDQANKNIENCRLALNRIYQGINLLENDNDAFEAFQYSNKAIQKQFLWKNKNTNFIWRPFQIAFFLLNLESTSNETSKDRNIFDLLWFPTGGGKTEAYLFLSAYFLFYSRLKKFENTSSVQILMRYTLRVLTIDQFTRIAALISACEILRKGDENKFGLNKITLGLWVGLSQTENYIENFKDNPDHSRPLAKCPCCDNPLDYSEIDLDKKEVFIKCVNPNRDCEIKDKLKSLPVIFIDEIIYVKKPSFLISTIDKFAQIARKDEALSLFKSNSKSKISLIIQDELHLISGPLGTLSGLYETAIDELTSYNGLGAKMIGSTATIKSANKQILNLYNRKSFQFPPPGINADNSFFAKEDKDSFRIYIGVSSIGRTEKYMLQAISASLLQSVKDKEIIDDNYFVNSYSTLVAYFNSLKILSGATAMMDEQVRDTIDAIAMKRNEKTRSENLNSPEELSGRKLSSEIPIIRDNLINRKPGEPDFIDILLATNMISVGLDIGRLNLMIVNGQPKTMSEYIQATSRVGRTKNSGLIISLYNHAKVRDRNRFESFKHWHGEIYKGVENTSVTPFASRSRDKALHVLLVILSKGVLGIKDPSTINKYKDKIIKEIFPIILKKVEKLDPMEKEDTEKELNKFLNYWEDKALQGKLKYFWHKKITQSLMMSLEDFAAKRQFDSSFNTDEIVAWPTPNSMRDVEPGVQFLCKDYPIFNNSNVDK